MTLKFGIISNARPGYAKVYFEEDNIVTDWWPVVLPYTLKDKVSYPLNVSEHVVCIADSRLEEGAILGAIHNSQDMPDAGASVGKFRKVFEDGTVIEYDKSAHKFKGTIIGSAEIEAQTVKITGAIMAEIEAANITLTGNVAISGNLAFGGSLSGGSGAASISFDGSTLQAPDVKAGAVSLLSHIHTGVTTGSGTTGPAV
jgi:phage baseplate assembly protein V